MTPLAGPLQLRTAAQVGPVVVFRVIACIFKRDALGGRRGEFFVAARRR